MRHPGLTEAEVTREVLRIFYGDRVSRLASREKFVSNRKITIR